MESVMSPLRDYEPMKMSRELRSNVLDHEEPAPAFLARDPAHVQHTVCEEAADYGADIGRHPEPGEAQRQLGLRVKVRQVEDEVRDESEVHVTSRARVERAIQRTRPV